MSPIVSRKSSTGIPLSAWTFLKTFSASRDWSCEGDCAAVNALPISPATNNPVAASTLRRGHALVFRTLDVISRAPDRTRKALEPSTVPGSRQSRIYGNPARSSKGRRRRWTRALPIHVILSWKDRMPVADALHAIERDASGHPLPKGFQTTHADLKLML